MRSTSSIIAAGVLSVACATQTVVAERWNGREIAGLIAAIGPADTTLTRSDASTYDWFRFGYCRLTARTTPDGKIVKIEITGTSRGCDVFLERMGG